MERHVETRNSVAAILRAPEGRKTLDRAIRRVRACVAAAIIAAAPATAVPAAAAGHAFTSPAGYSLRYPAGWTPVQVSRGRLLILSHGRRAHGPVIGQHQAAILVRLMDADEPVDDVTETIDAADPASPQTVTRLYRADGARRVLVQLTRWNDDPHEAEYRRIAADIAASIRFAVPK